MLNIVQEDAQSDQSTLSAQVILFCSSSNHEQKKGLWGYFVETCFFFQQIVVSYFI